MYTYNVIEINIYITCCSCFNIIRSILHMYHIYHNSSWGTENMQGQCIVVWKQLCIYRLLANKPEWSTCSSSDQLASPEYLMPSSLASIHVTLILQFQEKDPCMWQSSRQNQYLYFGGILLFCHLFPPSVTEKFQQLEIQKKRRDNFFIHKN